MKNHSLDEAIEFRLTDFIAASVLFLSAVKIKRKPFEDMNSAEIVLSGKMYYLSYLKELCNHLNEVLKDKMFNAHYVNENKKVTKQMTCRMEKQVKEWGKNLHLVTLDVWLKDFKVITYDLFEVLNIRQRNFLFNIDEVEEELDRIELDNINELLVETGIKEEVDPNEEAMIELQDSIFVLDSIIRLPDEYYWQRRYPNVSLYD